MIEWAATFADDLFLCRFWVKGQSASPGLWDPDLQFLRHNQARLLEPKAWIWRGLAAKPYKAFRHGEDVIVLSQALAQNPDAAGPLPASLPLRELLRVSTEALVVAQAARRPAAAVLDAPGFQVLVSPRPAVLEALVNVHQVCMPAVAFRRGLMSAREVAEISQMRFWRLGVRDQWTVPRQRHFI